MQRRNIFFSTGPSANISPLRKRVSTKPSPRMCINALPVVKFGASRMTRNRFSESGEERSRPPPLANARLRNTSMCLRLVEDLRRQEQLHFVEVMIDVPQPFGRHVASNKLDLSQIGAYLAHRLLQILALR